MLGLCGVIFAGCDSDPEKEVEVGALELPEVVEFNAHIRPIFAQNCSACHGGVKKSGGISWVFEEEAIVEGSSGKMTIVRGDAAASHIMEKITSDDPEVRMPPPEHGPPLSETQIALVERWINQGAEWQQHWSFVKPEKPEVPTLEDDSWSRTDIDRFLLARLREEGLEPSAEAGKGALLRRVTLDLTGLPPTKEEMEAFLADDSEEAYESLVDRLLASPHFGERWASMWLDLARYADSGGGGRDTPRPTMYKYRDWVIQALNADMPFDEFTIKQIAGDLLPNATLNDYVATAFHRNTVTENEGGTDDEEFRVAAQMDRVNTTWQVWHGTTMSCVQCHSHPYDPIRHDEYFQFMDFFNNTKDGDLKQEYPLLKVPRSQELQNKLGPIIVEKERIQESLWQKSAELVEGSSWQWLRGMESRTNREKQLSYTFEDQNGREEFHFSGTPTPITQTISAAVPDLDGPLQALRLEVRPDDLEGAPAKASPGFRLDRIKVTLIQGNGERRELALDEVFLDEPFPFLKPSPTGMTGFSALNHIFHDRWAVFRFAESLSVEPGSRIEVELEHGANSGQKDLLLIRRGAIALSDDPRWREIDQAPEYQEDQKRLTDLTAKLSEEKFVSVPVIRERQEHLRRETKTFVRGNWTDLGEVQRGDTPDSLHPMKDTGEPKRLQMARWLVDVENPLTARVFVSRIWEQLFGTGIVETLEDFGSVGLEPSHPELLDFLAVSFMHEDQWSIKSLIRSVVLSSAYRQDHTSTPELNERDPRNRLLARGPRVRLTAEMVRDQVLALSGDLNSKRYGPGVKPELPTGGWSPSHPQAGEWVTSSEEEGNRRSIYVHWQRSSLFPAFAAFDAPSRDLCSDRRINSNTPVQPLFTLNDPSLFRATQGFSRRMQEAEGSVEDQIAYGYRLATAQKIPMDKLEKLKALHDQVVTLYPQSEEALRGQWNREVEHRIAARRLEQKRLNQKAIRIARKRGQEPPEDLPKPWQIKAGPGDAFSYSAEQAAFDNIAAVILNLDAILTK